MDWFLFDKDPVIKELNKTCYISRNIYIINVQVNKIFFEIVFVLYFLKLSRTFVSCGYNSLIKKLAKFFGNWKEPRRCLALENLPFSTLSRGWLSFPPPSGNTFHRFKQLILDSLQNFSFKLCIGRLFDKAIFSKDLFQISLEFVSHLAYFVGRLIFLTSNFTFFEYQSIFEEMQSIHNLTIG